MIKGVIRRALAPFGIALHRTGTVERLLDEVSRLRRDADLAQDSTLADPNEEYARLRIELRKYRSREIFSSTVEDHDSVAKCRRIVDAMPQFGAADFAELASWLFASSLLNHRVVHQRIDEASLLWRAVKMSGGPILEVGRAAGGSTLILLGASGNRKVVSIDRDPFHAPIAERVFRRPDVASRTVLYRQTSREPISEHDFGMVFIDADHSYEGVCHDIATFWNQLKSFDGRPALAAFHDGAENPITYVHSVKTACDELLAEPGVARVVESWGSMLVVEKLADIDQDRWFTKEHSGFWEQYATWQHPVLKPKVVRGTLRPDQPPAKTGTINLLGEQNLEDESWLKQGLVVETAELNQDNPLRLVRELPHASARFIEKTVRADLRQVKFSVFLRPHRLETVRLSILDQRRAVLAFVDFRLGVESRIEAAQAGEGSQLLNAAFLYRNGFFGCDIAVKFAATVPAASFQISAVDAAPADGESGRGFFVNLFSVRELV